MAIYLFHLFFPQKLFISKKTVLQPPPPSPYSNNGPLTNDEINALSSMEIVPKDPYLQCPRLNIKMSSWCWCFSQTQGPATRYLTFRYLTSVRFATRCRRCPRPSLQGTPPRLTLQPLSACLTSLSVSLPSKVI